MLLKIWLLRYYNINFYEYHRANLNTSGKFLRYVLSSLKFFDLSGTTNALRFYRIFQLVVLKA